jgi:hypothetical protein
MGRAVVRVWRKACGLVLHAIYTFTSVDETFACVAAGVSVVDRIAVGDAGLNRRHAQVSRIPR